MSVEQTSESPWKIKPGHFGNSASNIVVIENFVELEDLKLIQEFYTDKITFVVLTFSTRPTLPTSVRNAPSSSRLPTSAQIIKRYVRSHLFSGKTHYLCSCMIVLLTKGFNTSSHFRLGKIR